MKEQVFRLISAEGEQRVCDAIPEEACVEVPRNATLNILNGACTKLAEQLASPGLVLAWLFSTIGASAALTGWLVPVKQAGSLLPQLAVAARIRRMSRRKWAWAVAGASQAIALLLMIPAVSLLRPSLAAPAVLFLLALFSVASGIGSVAFQDVAAKTIPKRRRGHLLGRRSLFGGVLTIIAGLVLKRSLGPESGLGVFLVLIGCAAILWFVGAVFFAMIREVPGATAGGRNALDEVRSGLGLLRRNHAYRKYLRARSLALLGIELALPFYALHALRYAGEGTGRLGLFVITNGLAATLSSTFWGRFADRSSRRVLLLGMLIGAMAGAYALAFVLLPTGWQNAWSYMPVFFLVGLAVAGVRLGRKTYLIDGAPADDRPTYVAFANTSMGVMTVAGGLLGLVGQALGPNAQVGLVAALCLLGAAAAVRMPEAGQLAESEQTPA
jgi:MFS family permease